MPSPQVKSNQEAYFPAFYVELAILPGTIRRLCICAIFISFPFKIMCFKETCHFSTLTEIQSHRIHLACKYPRVSLLQFFLWYFAFLPLCSKFIQFWVTVPSISIYYYLLMPFYNLTIVPRIT